MVTSIEKMVESCYFRRVTAVFAGITIKIENHDLYLATNKIFSENFAIITAPMIRSINIHVDFFALIKLEVWLIMVWLL